MFDFHAFHEQLSGFLHGFMCVISKIVIPRDDEKFRQRTENLKYA
jgi:hypothetical protein